MSRAPKMLGTCDLTTAEKLARHALAQKRYVERNRDSERRKARARMEKRRASIKLSETETKLAAERRREVDADYRERQQQNKFIENYGRRMYKKHYLPLYETMGNGRHLPGIDFALDIKKGRAKKLGREERVRKDKARKDRRAAASASET
ncbi:hypothetical protein B0H15DRAFT_804722 [Mycena belliarum]|uniref:Uncharacterized protein n=1 Tax=Mycena belliarum TaxID=1033014 RepID=A0AAD6TVB1_9AGAR|nr:hypothetical protein B0H15DRAFT_804722 [Mycena belliae]